MRARACAEWRGVTLQSSPPPHMLHACHFAAADERNRIARGCSHVTLLVLTCFLAGTEQTTTWATDLRPRMFGLTPCSQRSVLRLRAFALVNKMARRGDLWICYATGGGGGW